MSYCRTCIDFTRLDVLWARRDLSAAERKGFEGCALGWCRRGYEKWWLFPWGRTGDDAALLFIYLHPTQKIKANTIHGGGQVWHRGCIILEKNCLSMQLTAETIFKEENSPKDAVLCAGPALSPHSIQYWVVWKELLVTWSDVTPRQN